MQRRRARVLPGTRTRKHVAAYVRARVIKVIGQRDARCGGGDAYQYLLTRPAPRRAACAARDATTVPTATTYPLRALQHRGPRLVVPLYDGAVARVAARVNVWRRRRG